MMLLIALLSFVGTHLLMSHPLRAPLVARLGEKGFAGVYSLVSVVTLGWSIWEWRRAPSGLLMWPPLSWAPWVAVPLMLIASILFVGSVSAPNPALMGAPKAPAGSTPRGVMAITRHPMMWSFAIWAVVHAWVSGDARTVLLCAAIGVLALVGARGQDGKKRGQMGEAWSAHERATSFVPFLNQLRGRAAITTLYPGAVATLGGILLFAVATWAHPYLGGPMLPFWSF
jgi:uncharacterized membrane protein